MYSKIKKGATSLIVTLFFTLLAGILVLSFVSIMLSNINESTNYNLSQSAYDAALAGIEDAKVMLLLYNNCVARGDIASARCKDVVEKIEAEDSNKNCDLIREALKRKSGDSDRETVIRTDNSSSAASGVDATFDMAYTCVLVSTETPNYLGTISKDTDTRIIPLRTHKITDDDGKAVSPIKYVRVEWFSNEDASMIVDNGLASIYDPAGIYNGSGNNGFANNKVNAENVVSGKNQFKADATLPPALNVGFVQAGMHAFASDATGFKLSDFKMRNETYTERTNRGRLTLRPIGASGTIGVNKIGKTAFPLSTMAAATNYNNTVAQSTYNADNSPMDVKCYTATTVGSHPYACSVDIELPDTYWSDTAQDGIRYLILSSPYASPDISFSVTLFNDEDKVVNFVGVQSSVDSTGRANDLFRRVDARVELIDTGYPFPKYTLGVYCKKGSDGNPDCSETGSIVKNYRATYDCWSINNGNVGTCKAGSNNYASDGDSDGGFDPSDT